MSQIRMSIGGTTPPSPPLNEVSFYAKADKRFYIQDDTGVEVKLLTDETTLSSLGVQAPLLSTGGNNPTLSLSNVTTTANGAMLATDKVKLNSATNTNAPNTLIMRDGLGSFICNEITAASFNGVATTVATIPSLSGAITSTGSSNLTTLGSNVITNSNISSSAAIAMSKLALNPTLRANHTGVQEANTLINLGPEIESHLFSSAPIVDAMISSTAQITLNKLAVNPLARNNHTGSQTASTISDFSIEVDLAVSDYLVSNPVTNAEIDNAAAISLSKLAVNPILRSNHTGTQLASTISNFNTSVVSALSASDGISISPLGEFNVVGTTDKITVDSNGVNIASTYTGQNSITTLGTISSGVWNGTVISTSFGGTGATTPGAAANKLLAVTNVSSSVTLNNNDGVVLVNASSGVRTVTLPSASTLYRYTIKKVDSSANTVVINAGAGNLIEGVSSKTLTTQYDHHILVSDGTTNWFLI